MAGEGPKKKKSGDGAKSKTIVFIHPDLGIGGAERLVVDAAVGLKKRGHKVVIFTSHCDPSHCFEEARDGTLDVRVRGSTVVPPSLLGRFSILCAILRQLHLILQIGVLTSELADLSPDAFFVDQLSAGLPFLSAVSAPSSSSRPRILFYCHFPDLLLARGRGRWWKRLYRVPFDALEGWSMGFADAVAVNSSFTKGVVARTWPALFGTGKASGRRGGGGTELRVVYPCVNVRGAIDGAGHDDGTEMSKVNSSPVGEAPLDWKDSEIILSINRFERKKNVALAIQAYSGLPSEDRKGVKLVIAGGYDNRVAENVSYHAELSDLATELGLRHATTKTVVTALSLARDPAIDVLFLLSVPSSLKSALLRSTRLLIYTPAEEHFGIVPLEAMLAGVPVLACDSGGPTETVLEGVTGWLRPPTLTSAWTEVVDLVLNRLPEEKRAEMRAAGPRRVRENFSDEQMAERLERIFVEMENQEGVGQRHGYGSGLLPFALVCSALVVVVGAVAISKLLLRRA